MSAQSPCCHRSLRLWPRPDCGHIQIPGLAKDNERCHRRSKCAQCQDMVPCIYDDDDDNAARHQCGAVNSISTHRQNVCARDMLFEFYFGFFDGTCAHRLANSTAWTELTAEIDFLIRNIASRDPAGVFFEKFHRKKSDAIVQTTKL